LASIHFVYVRILGKGITMFWLASILCMLGSRVRGSHCIDSYGMMMMILVKGVSVMCQTKIIMFDLIKSGMEVNSERGNNYL